MHTFVSARKSTRVERYIFQRKRATFIFAPSPRGNKKKRKTKTQVIRFGETIGRDDFENN